MSTDGQGTKWRRNIAKIFNRLSTVHERYRRQTTDDRRTDGRRHIATFAKTHQRVDLVSSTFSCAASAIVQDYFL